MNSAAKRLAVCGVGVTCALGVMARTTQADVITKPRVYQFGVFKDTNGDQELSHADTRLASATNMLEYLTAGTSYGYKQYDNPKGADLSGWPSSSEGTLSGDTHKTWLKPEPNALQFWIGWSRKDHDPGTPDNVNPDFDSAARGYHLGIIMNRENTHWDQSLNGGQGAVVHEPAGSADRNSVKLDISVQGSQTTPIAGEPNDPYNIRPRVVLSDDFSTDAADFPNDPPNSDELPRPPAPTAGDPYPAMTGQELVADGTVDPGWDYHFVGDWTYKEDAGDPFEGNSTDGGVIGNLRAGYDVCGEFVVRIKLDQLSDGEIGHTGINKVVFYSFFDHTETGIYDPTDPDTYDVSKHRADAEFFAMEILDVSEGDTIFITNCCHIAPEPVTLALLVAGGLGVVGLGWRGRRRQAA